MMLWLLTACAPQVALDDSAGGVDAAGLHAVVTTTDFSVGTLGTVAAETLGLQDELAPTSGDPQVVVDGGLVLQINAWQHDSVRVYEPGQFGAPLLELSVGAGTNPHHAVLIDGLLVVSLYETEGLGLFDPQDGTPLGHIDLSDLADGDGRPEPSRMVERGGRLLVALQNLDRDAGFAPRQGVVAEVDVARRQITGSWRVGPSPQVYADPTDPDGLWVLTGSYHRGRPTGFVPVLDGGLAHLDVGTGRLEPVLDEQSLGVGLTGLSAAPDGRLALLGDDGDGHFALHCLDPQTGAFATSPPTPLWLADVAVDPRGVAWVAARALTGGADSGLWRYDLGGCAPLPDVVRTSLPPYRIAFYDEESP